MPIFRVLGDRIVPEPGGEGFLLPVSVAPATGPWRATMDPADFAVLGEAYRAAGFFRPEINAFAPDWSRARPLLAVDLRGLVSIGRDLPGAPEGPGGQRRLWAALNHGLAAGIDASAFLADAAARGRDGKAELSAAFAGFLRDEKTSPYRLGRFSYWNGRDAGAWAGDPVWVAV